MPLNSLLILIVVKWNRKKDKKQLNSQQLFTARDDYKLCNE